MKKVVLEPQKITKWNNSSLKKFKKLCQEEVAVFLPHCLREDIRNQTTLLLIDYNFKKVFNVDGPSQLLDILQNDKTIKAVIGIACDLEIAAAKRNIALPKIAVKLLTAGCKKTEFSLTVLEEWLKKVKEKLKN